MSAVHQRIFWIGILSAAIIAACGSQRSPSLGRAAQPNFGSLPRAPAHIVIVIEENRRFESIVGNTHLAAIRQMIADGALFSDSHGVTHPSLPNYFALFTGKTNSDGDRCTDSPVDSGGDRRAPSGLQALMPTLASELLAARRTFIGYAESLPYPGYVGCFGRLGSLLSPYYKRHVPWAFFTRANYLGLAKSDTHGLLLPDSADQPWSAFPEPDAYDTLPTVAMVTPNAGHDMHGYFLENDSADLTADGDEWLAANILPLERWVLDPKNDALLIVTWDESDRERGKPDTNHIPTIFVGSMVRHGTYGERIDHYSVLATLEQFYKLPRLGASAQAQPILGCWR